MRALVVLAFTAALSLAHAAPTFKQVVVRAKAGLPSELGMTPAVAAECMKLEFKVAEAFLETLAGKGFKGLTASQAEAEAEDVPQLLIELTGVVAPGGGGFSGSKSVSARLLVSDRDGPLASTIQTASARGGFSGNCSLLERASEGLGKRLAGWYIKAHAGQFALPESAQRGVALAVLAPAGFHANAVVPDAVRQECDLGPQVATRTQGQLARYFQDVVPVKDLAEAGSRRVVRQTILEVVGAGGGAVTGSKSMRVLVELLDGTQVIDQFETQSVGGRGGIFNPELYKGSCAILSQVTERIGQLTARWVATRATAPERSAQPAAETSATP